MPRAQLSERVSSLTRRSLSVNMLLKNERLFLGNMLMTVDVCDTKKLLLNLYYYFFVTINVLYLILSIDVFFRHELF